jgi:hypothetical protein
MTYLDNDLALLASLGEQTPLAPLASLAAARSRLTAAITTEPASMAAQARPAAAGRAARATGTDRPRPARQWISRRPWLAIGAAAAAAAVAAAAVLAAGSSPPAAPVTARLTAVQVLDYAAAAAQRQPAVIPRPGQFYYTAISGDGFVTRTWRSVDGSRNGLEVSGAQQTVLTGCVDGRPKVRPGGDGGNQPQPCVPGPAYLPGLPARAAAIDGYLARSISDPNTRRNPVVRQKFVERVLRTNYLLPAQRAALYEFIAATPGMKAVSDVRDGAGRRSVGVSSTDGMMTVILIFDPRTYAYLGTTVRYDDRAHGLSGDSSVALVATAIVDRVGQLP